MKEKEYLNKSELLSRNYWNKGLLKSLLPEPDKIEYRNNGTVYRYIYSIKSIEEAETTGLFQERVKSVELYYEQQAQRKHEIEQSFFYSIEKDIDNMKVPETGTFDQVYENCKHQMFLFNSMKNIVCFDFQTNYPSPNLEIIRRISKQRPDLAFEAGVYFFEANCRRFGGHGGSTAKLLMQDVMEADAEEESLGKPVYYIGSNRVTA